MANKPALIIYPYNKYSTGARTINRNLKNNGYISSIIDPSAPLIVLRDTYVLNWGNPHAPEYKLIKTLAEGWINPPLAVELAHNKLTCFNHLRAAGVSVPEYTKEEAVVTSWLRANNEVLARTLLRASGGRGIQLISAEQPAIIPAQLYVKYIKKQYEYRIHVFNNKIIHMQQKVRRIGFDNTDSKIRNYNNGWNFAHKDIIIPNNAVLTAALAAVAALGLHFGAVDIIWNAHYKKEYVLEVNTAPGLEGTTIDKYINAILTFVS